MLVTSSGGVAGTPSSGVGGVDGPAAPCGKANVAPRGGMWRFVVVVAVRHGEI